MKEKKVRIVNQAKIFTSHYLDNKKGGLMDMFVSLPTAQEQCQLKTAEEDPKEIKTCDCRTCRVITRSTLNKSTLACINYMKKNNIIISYNMAALLLKKFKNIRSGNIFQAKNIYKIFIEKYNSFPNKTTATENSIIALHAAMVDVISTYINTSDDYKIAIIMEDLKPVLDNYKAIIKIIIFLFNKSNTADWTILLNSVGIEKANRHNIKSKLNALSITSLMNLSKGVEKQCKDRKIKKLNTRYFDSEINFIDSIDKDQLINLYEDNPITTETKKNILNKFNTWLEKELNEICSEKNLESNYIFTAMLKHKQSEARFFATNEIDSSYIANLKTKLQYLYNLVRENQATMSKDKFLKFYFFDTTFLYQLYFVYEKNIGVDVFKKLINEYTGYLSDNENDKISYAKKLTIFRLLDIYKYIKFGKISLVDKSKEQEYLAIIFTKFENLIDNTCDEFIIRKRLQFYLLHQKDKIVNYTNTIFSRLNDKISRRTLDMLIKANHEAKSETNINKLIELGIKKEFYVKPKLMKYRDVSCEQKKHSTAMYIVEESEKYRPKIIIDTHTHTPKSYGGGYYGTAAISVTISFLKWIKSIINLKTLYSQNYNDSKITDTINVIKKVTCSNYINDKKYKLDIEIITGGNTNKKRIINAIKKSDNSIEIKNDDNYGALLRCGV
jgi:hypothetical protein